MCDVYNAAHTKRCLDADAGKVRKKKQCVRKFSVKAIQSVFQCQFAYKAGN